MLTKKNAAAMVGIAFSTMATAAPAEISGLTLQVRGSMPIRAGQALPQAVDPKAWYSNVTTFAGSGFVNGGSADQAGNAISRLVCDDVNFDAGLSGRALSTFTFSVYNSSATTFSARPRVRFFADNAGVPGTVLAGFSFNAISFTANNVGLFSADVSANNITVPGSGATKIWACMTFDNNTGATGATLADIDALGQAVFDPVDLGSSGDLYFITTSAGSFLANNPAGSVASFGSAPPANFAWQFTDASLPVELQQFDVE